MKRIIKYIFLIILSGASIQLSASDQSDGNMLITMEKGEDGRKFIKSVFTVKGDPEQVYCILRDVEKFPEFMPGSSEVEILEKSDCYQIVKFSGNRGPLNADIVMRRNIDDSNRRIEWVLVDGPPREVCGYWHVERDSKRAFMTIVHYANYVDAGALIPGFLVRKYLCEDIKKMVPNIIKRVESGGSWVSDEYLEKNITSTFPDKP